MIHLAFTNLKAFYFIVHGEPWNHCFYFGSKMQKYIYHA